MARTQSAGRLLAPYEQNQPHDYPGVQTGDEPRPMMLFDLESDPSEQRDIAALHPEVVARLAGYVDRLRAERGAASGL